MPINAILFGATGMVGEGVLHEALRDPSVSSVLVVGRRSCRVTHPKLRELIHADFFDYAGVEEQLRPYNACFFCLGVSSIGKSEPEYTRTTYDLTMHAAQTLARLNPGMTFCYISGAGTDRKGGSMWARVKGRTEDDLASLPFNAVYNFRPGFLRPTPGLQHAFFFAKALGLFYPLLRLTLSRYVTTLEELGLAMIRVAATGYPGGTLECRDIVAAARRPQ
jgi:uncharacterized protein YbjT (DUF2867 family)